jgi:hypothetical protein
MKTTTWWLRGTEQSRTSQATGHGVRSEIIEGARENLHVGACGQLSVRSQIVKPWNGEES